MLKTPDLRSTFITSQTLLILRSFRQFLNFNLLELDEALQNFIEADNSTMASTTMASELADKLFYAPYVVLSHTSEADPCFNYANAMALKLFEYTWEEIITLPSRYSAEPINREAREQLLAIVTQQGYIDNYSGIRISATGNRFKIDKAIVWNLVDANGAYRGQAACFDKWEFLSNNNSLSNNNTLTTN